MKNHQPNSKNTPRLVQIMHKLTGKSSDKTSELAIGRVFNFRSGDRYRVLSSGAVVRVDPKPWRNKSERRQVIKARREARITA